MDFIDFTQPKVQPRGSAFVLLEDYVVQWFEGKTLCRAIIPKGFVFEVSVPRLFWTILGLTPGHPKALAAACLHDWLYRKGGNLKTYFASFYSEWVFSVGWVTVKRKWTRLWADGAFESLLGISNVWEPRSRTAYLFLRLFGWIAWKTA